MKDRPSRRWLLQAGTATAVSTAILPESMAGDRSAPQEKESSGRILNAYYLRAQMYTMVPKQIREDMEWMAGIGTNAVSIAVLEQDFFAAQRNIELIHREAARVGMKIYATPSRWGGLVAGAPKVPSLFSVLHPETWVLNRDGSPAHFSGTSGVMSSVYHPATFEFFCQSIDKIFNQFGFDGITWDEPKAFRSDYSSAATKSLGTHPTKSDFIRGAAKFYSRISQYTQRYHSGKTITLFMMASNSNEEASVMGESPGFNYFGCDGGPWNAQALADEEQNPKPAKSRRGPKRIPKVLLGRGEFFLSLARRNGKKGILLIENCDMPASMIKIMDSSLDQVLALKPDQLIYYYYGRNTQDPDRNMAVVARHLRKFRV